MYLISAFQLYLNDIQFLYSSQKTFPTHTHDVKLNFAANNDFIFISRLFNSLFRFSVFVGMCNHFLAAKYKSRPSAAKKVLVPHNYALNYPQNRRAEQSAAQRKWVARTKRR